MGLMAQDLEAVFPELIQEVSADRNHNEKEGEGEHTPHSADDREEFKFKAVNYSGLVPVLIAGMQEQQRDMESKDLQINALEERINRLARVLSQMASDRAGAVLEKTNAPVAATSQLIGNRPNPFQQNTTIDFELDPKVLAATLCIFNMEGKEVKRMVLEARGKGSVDMSFPDLAAGVYMCSIVADGKALPGLKMTLLG